ncbi:MAG: ABC transporter ATP-binding protein [Armatimonadota bacterium]|nr:MAG: ABC transporter ATP-binding protein [Armatimonadota bacterium]
MSEASSEAGHHHPRSRRAETPTPSAAALELRGVTFTYRDADRPALRDANLTIGAGEFVIVMGEGGAGKSTLCRCANGLIPHFQKGEFTGAALVFGEDTRTRSVRELARRVGLVFQDFESQLFSTSVELEAAFGPENFGVPRDEMAGLITQSLAATSLTGMERRAPATLSGGEKQRLAIASVLACGPDLFVLDEPTTDLDPEGKRQVFSIARELRQRRRGCPLTVVMVEHETEESLSAERAVVMQAGEVAYDGPTRDLLAQPDLMESHGIRPLPAAALLAALGEQARAANDAEALSQLAALGYRFDRPRWDALASDDAHAAGGAAAIVEVRCLSHSYDGARALDGVDLTIREGEFVAILGQNGSGKTTLVKHFNGLMLPREGAVRVGGVETRRQSARDLSHRVGYVFQNPDHQIFADTVREEVAFGPRNFGLPEREIAGRVESSLAAVGLAGLEDADPFSLTKGERQRVAVASALATQPQVLVLDEPTTGLDYRQNRGMMDLLRRLNKAGHTIVIVTHSMWVAAEYARRAVVLSEGTVILDCGMREAMAQPGVLAQARLRAPQAARLGGALGGVTLSVDELAQCLTKDNRT